MIDFLRGCYWDAAPVLPFLLLAWWWERLRIRELIARNQAGAFCPHGIRRPKNCRPCNEAFFADEPRKEVTTGASYTTPEPIKPVNFGGSYSSLFGLGALLDPLGAGLGAAAARHYARAKQRSALLLENFMDGPEDHVDAGLESHLVFGEHVLSGGSLLEKFRLKFSSFELLQSCRRVRVYRSGLLMIDYGLEAYVFVQAQMLPALDIVLPAAHQSHYRIDLDFGKDNPGGRVCVAYKWRENC